MSSFIKSADRQAVAGLQKNKSSRLPHHQLLKQQEKKRDHRAMKKSIKKNYIYNLIYQTFTLITPLITIPYISRILGSFGIGQHSFTASIASYFILFGSLGFSVYAQREIARFQDNKIEQTKIFYEIIIARSISVFLALIIHVSILCSGVYGETYTLLMWILTINIGATAFDITFLLQGNEEFGTIALRNVIVKIVGILTIFLFVKNESHVWLYTLCQSVILILSNLSLWTRLPKMLVKIGLKDLNIRRHFIPTLRLFIPTVAVSIYTVLDKTLIGILVPGTTVIDGVEKNVSDIENGYYDQAEKIIKMAMTVITALGTVMVPRNSYAIASGDIDSFKRNIRNALKFVVFFGLPIVLGIVALSDNFSSWFFGKGYEKVPYLMITLSPLVIVLGFSNVLGLQYLLPQKKDSKYTVAVSLGAIINLILNIFLVKSYWSFGAAIAKFQQKPQSLF